eukprot:1144520-Pelagomonas_calceolata.AAC.1
MGTPVSTPCLGPLYLMICPHQQECIPPPLAHGHDGLQQVIRRLHSLQVFPRGSVCTFASSERNKGTAMQALIKEKGHPGCEH